MKISNIVCFPYKNVSASGDFIFFKNCGDAELGYSMRCSRGLVLPSCKGNLSARAFFPINAGSSNLELVNQTFSMMNSLCTNGIVNKWK